jgi:hypothetical protein
MGYKKIQARSVLPQSFRIFDLLFLNVRAMNVTTASSLRQGAAALVLSAYKKIRASHNPQASGIPSSPKSFRADSTTVEFGEGSGALAGPATVRT